MKISQLLAAAILSAVSCIASAVPMATMTFDVDFIGVAHLRSGNVLLEDSKSTTATIVFPVQVLYAGISESMYSKDLVASLGWAGVGKQVSILSSMNQYFMTDLMGTYVRQGLDELGLSSNFVASQSLSYASLLKRQSAGSNQSEHYNMFDASSDFVTYDLEGDPNATFMSMIRLWGVGNVEQGGLDPFDAVDIPQMLIDISRADHGYVLQYTIFVDRYKDIKTHEMIDRPVEITYGGDAHLTGFSIDGRDMLEATVPEPSTLALFILGAAVCIGIGLKRRGSAA